MSDIYLTKVEKKELFIRSLVYTVSIFVIAYFSVAGPFLFTLVPWTFLIGIYGRLRYKDAIVTLLVSIITVIYANITSYGFNTYSVINIIISMIGALTGNIIGKMLFKLRRSYKLELFIKVNEKNTYKIVSIICTILIVLVYAYFNGDFVSYAVSRVNLHNSIVKELGENTDYKITGIKHVVGANFRYEYEVNAKGAHIKSVEDKGKVWYINASNVSQNMSNSLKSKILDSINQDKFSFKYNIDVDADSTINAIMPNEVYININITECIEEEYVNVAVLCREIYNCIQNENVAGVFLNVNNNSALFSKEDMEVLTLDEILAAFEVIKLDS